MLNEFLTSLYTEQQEEHEMVKMAEFLESLPDEALEKVAGEMGLFAEAEKVLAPAGTFDKEAQDKFASADEFGRALARQHVKMAAELSEKDVGRIGKYVERMEGKSEGGRRRAARIFGDNPTQEATPSKGRQAARAVAGGFTNPVASAKAGLGIGAEGSVNRAMKMHPEKSKLLNQGGRRALNMVGPSAYAGAAGYGAYRGAKALKNRGKNKE